MAAAVADFLFCVHFSVQVRVDCIQGLRKLGQLRTVNWSRMADDLCMYPSPHMIRLVDKKFGGELNKVCVGEVWEQVLSCGSGLWAVRWRAAYSA